MGLAIDAKRLDLPAAETDLSATTMSSVILVTLDVANTFLDANALVGALPSAAIVVGIINAWLFCLPAVGLAIDAKHALLDTLMVTAMSSVALPAVVLASVSAESCFVVGVVIEDLSTDLDNRVSDDLVTEEATEGVDNPKIEEKDDMIGGGLYVGWIDGSMCH